MVDFLNALSDGLDHEPDLVGLKSFFLEQQIIKAVFTELHHDIVILPFLVVRYSVNDIVKLLSN